MTTEAGPLTNKHVPKLVGKTFPQVKFDREKKLLQTLKLVA